MTRDQALRSLRFGPKTAAQIAEMYGCLPTDVSSVMAKVKKRGGAILSEPVGRGKTSVYRLA